MILVWHELNFAACLDCLLIVFWVVFGTVLFWFNAWIYSYLILDLPPEFYPVFVFRIIINNNYYYFLFCGVCLLAYIDFIICLAIILI